MSLGIQTHLDVRAVACVHIRYQRWDSAAVSLKAQRQQYRSIERNTDKVILCSVMRSQHDRRQIGPPLAAPSRHLSSTDLCRDPRCRGM
jgi:hypothetical protein